MQIYKKVLSLKVKFLGNLLAMSRYLQTLNRFCVEYYSSTNQVVCLCHSLNSNFCISTTISSIAYKDLTLFNSYSGFDNINVTSIDGFVIILKAIDSFLNFLKLFPIINL